MALKYAILGDIHANWEALSAVLADAESQGVTRFSCVGDIVGYNADPELCLEKVHELCGDAVVRGNHDHYCSRQENLNGFHPLAADVVDWTRKRLSDDQRAWLGNLRYSRTVETFMLVHATLDNPEMWGYVFDKLEAEANFAYQMCSVCFFGHTHVPLAFDSRHRAGRPLHQAADHGGPEILHQRGQRGAAARRRSARGLCHLRHGPERGGTAPGAVRHRGHPAQDPRSRIAGARRVAA